MMVEFEVAGEERRVDIEEMTIAELELASLEGNQLAQEELKRRREII